MKRLLYGYVPGFSGAVPYYGCRVFFPPGSALFKILCRQGVFEPEIIKILVSTIRPGTTLFDVGANIGLMAIPVLKQCLTSKVVSFEPSPNSLPWLQKTVEASTYKTRWSIVEKALADSQGEMSFVTGAPKNSLFERLEGKVLNEGGSTIRVPVSTLDYEWESRGRPAVSVVKIDVEGADGLVLEGGKGLFKQCRPCIVLEWYEEYLNRFGTSPYQLLEFARQFDYRVFSIPAGVSVQSASELKLQMMFSSNFVLLDPSNS